MSGGKSKLKRGNPDVGARRVALSKMEPGAERETALHAEKPNPYIRGDARKIKMCSFIICAEVRLMVYVGLVFPIGLGMVGEFYVEGICVLKV